MNQKPLLLVLGLFFATCSYAQSKEPKLMFPKEVTNYVQQRTLCNQARAALIFRDTPKEQIPANPKQQVQQYCMGSDAQYQALIRRYQNNPRALDELALVKGSGDIVALDAPIQFGQTIDALMPKDILAFLPQFSSCLHFAGEFGGNRSERDREINRTMGQLKCHQIERKLTQLKKTHKNNSDVQMFLKSLSEHY